MVGILRALLPTRTTWLMIVNTHKNKWW